MVYGMGRQSEIKADNHSGGEGNMNQIILKPVDAYEVTTKDGESLGQFIRGKSWNGMSELRNGGELIIIDDGIEFISMLDSMFTMDKPPKTVYVVKASPRVTDLLLAAKQRAQQAAETPVDTNGGSQDREAQR